MKTHKFIKQFFSIMSSILIVAVSVLSYSSVSYAYPRYNRYTGKWEDVPFSQVWDDFNNFLALSLAQCGAAVSGDFAQYLQNQEDWVNYWTEDNVITNTETGEITLSSDLVAYIKQALKEYQQEQYGYQILPTIKYDQIPVSRFPNASAYRTMCELADKYGIIGLSIPSSKRVLFVDMTPYINGESGFIMNAYGDTRYQVCLMDYTAWTYTYRSLYILDDLDTTLYSWDEVLDYGSVGVNINTFFSSTNSFSVPYLSNSAWLVSYSGSDVLVFNSATSLKNYSVDKRGVFTTSDFYKDTGALTVSIDDLNKSIGDLTDLLEQFKDLIGKQEGSLTEDQLQQLLKEFLDEFFNRLGNNGGDDNNDNGGSSGGDIDIPDGFFDSIAGYCNSVLTYLESIVFEIQNLEFLTWQSSVDEEHSDLFDMFDKIWDDPETGSQEVADELSMSFSDLATGITKKFPFSIPWDVYALFTVFANVDPPQTQGISAYLLSDSELDYSESISADTAVYSVDSRGVTHDAPYFELPIVVASFGIEEYIIVDLKDFQSISTLSRTMLSLLFGVFLMKFTIKIIELFKGGTDT